MINRKAKGSAWERDIIHALESDGFACTRAAGSMGIWDIVAINCHSVWLIQAKCNGWGSRAEREAMGDFPAPENVYKQLWRKDDGGGVRIRVFLWNGWVDDLDASAIWTDIIKEMKCRSRKKK